MRALKDITNTVLKASKWICLSDQSHGRNKEDDGQMSIRTAEVRPYYFFFFALAEARA